MKKKLLVTDLPCSEYEGKRVFVRVDFNVPVNGGRITEDYRIRRAIRTIDYLTKCGGQGNTGFPHGKTERTQDRRSFNGSCGGET